MRTSVAGLSSLIVASVIAGCGGGSPDPITHQVVAVAGAGGTIIPSSQSVRQGYTAAFSVLPDADFEIAAVTGCDGSLDGNIYTTGAISAACTVSAHFSSSLAAPQSLETIAGDGEVTLKWEDVAGAAGYTLYFATAGGIQPANFGIWVSQHDGVMLEGVTSPHTVKGLANGTEYFFVVTATAEDRESAPSNEVSAVPSEAPVVTGQLNDTGITWSGSALSGNLTTCHPAPPAASPARQDCHYGRDAQAAAGTLVKVGGGNAGFDFTKIANTGAVLSARAMLGDGPNDWACTRDNVTGLIWEVKVDDPSHLRDQNHTYTWYEPASPDGDPGIPNGGVCVGSACDTTSFVQAVNTQGLCGARDWRIATRHELQGIADYGRHSPAIDITYFPNTPSQDSPGPGPPVVNWSWSGSPSAVGSSQAWLVNHGDGRVRSDVRGSKNRVRLVRGGM